MTMLHTLNTAKAMNAKATAKAEAIAKTVAKYEAKEAVKAYADYTVNYAHLISASVEVADAKGYGIDAEIVAKLSYICYSGNKEVAVAEALAKASAEVASLAVEAIAKVSEYAKSLAWYQVWAKADAEATLKALLKAEAKHTVVATLVKTVAFDVTISAKRMNINY
jgi:hypothetical protein